MQATSGQEQNDDVKLIQTEDGAIPFLKDIWGFFGKKGVKTRFFSINSNQSYRLDIEVCESLGCPINIVTDSAEIVQKWETIQKTVKNRKVAEEDSEKTWLQGMEKKWILPKNINIKQTVFSWKTLEAEIQSNPESRCDILKIEAENDIEHMFLANLLSGCFRPGLIVLRYTEDPDANVPSMMTAGNLHMAGYKLLAVEGRWFLYLYTDVCLYESVSMRNTKVQNPIAQYLADLLIPKPVKQPETKTSEETQKPTEE